MGAGEENHVVLLAAKTAQCGKSLESSTGASKRQTNYRIGSESQILQSPVRGITRTLWWAVF